ncbi:FH1/FH2 domain-containing protein 3 isoform X4 [Episyrphus balteatus]|uniref:FH1/FH2 domain-containing protein 3 isoform X4 n=1 Tax=Episyrphus balteatus TaxID=286459 RepID=UPI002485A44F|nr:FH1/FH2 domain-containing protein 3 isoform X4 [Episyrphus balteatus]
MIVKMDPDELITFRVQYLVDTDPLNCTSMYPIPTRAPTYAFATTMPLATQLGTILRLLGAPQRLDDAALQVYKDGDYGAYLDLESSLAEQTEEIEGLNTNRKNSLVVRTQLSVRVHAIIEKLLTSEGSELRRALFSLKQVFQEDKDLVHAFVALGGLNCLVRVGNGADQNYQNYILRALGQVMLYVDGMNGVMKHEPTMQWLYSLIASKYRLVVKTALKLLLVFVEYVETNCYLLVNAIHAVDSAQGTLPWSNIMKLLKDYDNADTELLIYATSLINKTLAGLNDQDSFYDESDLLEQQGMEGVIQRYMSRPGTDLDLLDQLQLYEAVLKFEDGEADGIRLPDNSLRKTMRYRPSTDTAERRKSRRHSTGTSPSANKVIQSPKRFTAPTHGILDEDSSSSNNSNEYANGYLKDNRIEPSITPGFRRRRERVERQKSFLREQQKAAANGIMSVFEKRDELGQIVTAMPVHLKQNSDSPPESLVLTNNNNDANNCSNNNATNNSLNANNNTTIINNNNNNNTYNTINNNNNNGLEYCSPTKILSTNGFDRNRQQQQLQPPSPVNLSNGNKQNGSPEFLSKKNLLMKSNATVINGIMKNINRNESENREAISYSSHKKFESDANRLNNYYSQMSTPKSQTVLGQKNHNAIENSMSKPTRTNVIAGNESPYHRLREMHSPSSPVMMDMGLPVVPEAVVMVKEPVFVPPPPPPPPPPSFWYAPLTVPQPPVAGTSLTEMIAGKVTPSTVSSMGEDGEDPGEESDNEEKRLLLQLKRDHTVKDLTTKLSNMPMSPTQEDKLQNRIVGDMTGLISKAKEGLAKSKSKGDISRSPSVDQEIKKADPKKSENELHWEELVKSMSRPLNLCDMDFTDLNSEDEKDVLAPRGLGGGIPPPPPPQGVPPPMMIGQIVCPPPMNMPPPLTNLVPPPMFSYNQGNYSNSSSLNNSINGDVSGSSTVKKNKKTVKLFWKEVREDMIPVAIGKTIWDELPKSNVDTQKLEHLFESRAKDLMTKEKQQEMNKNKEIIVLDHKRSNAINIAMTKLPPPRAIKAAILKMDATVVTREGIDKLLNMLPTDEERGKIQEAQMANPELPLGSAEQFLLTLASISELAARLKLWAFRLDFENSEKEIAEPLMDLKQGIELLRQNRTFKCILSTLLSVGIFLNGAPVKGFQIEYLAKVPEVKDTVHKHSLLHHLCHMVMETCTETTDLYSEIGPITRASKADFADLAHNLIQLETECKSSWDRLKLIAKHDCPPQLKQKLVDFLADCAERIIILQIVHRRIINRYRKFLLWLGVPQHSVAESKPNEFCRIVSEFALEYRTTRERVQQQIEKKANHRERNKTRGKMIIDVGKFRTKEDRADAELKELLGSPSPGSASLDGTLTWRRRRAENLRSPIIKQNDDNFTDGDDEILESLVKTATKTSGPRPTPRERKRTRHADRKSLRRTLKNGLTEEEKQHVAALIKTY